MALRGRWMQLITLLLAGTQSRPRMRSLRCRSPGGQPLAFVPRIAIQPGPAWRRLRSVARVTGNGRCGWPGPAGRGAGARIVCQVTAVVAAAAVAAGCGGAGHRRQPGSPGPRAAGITVTPSRRLSDGQRVRVTVRGFPPDAKVFLSECAPAGRARPIGCGRRLAAQPFLLADAQGAATGRFVVHFVLPSGPLGAPAAKCWQGCVLVATIGTPGSGRTAVATAMIRFGSPPASPAPPVVVPAAAPLTVLSRIRVPHRAWQLAAGDGALFTQEAGPTITRVDPATGRVGPIARVGAVAAMAVAGRLLWVVRLARSPRGAPPPLLALNLDTLTVEHSVALPDQPGWGGGDIAVAGGLIWIAGTHSLVAIDPARARLVAIVPLPAVAGTDGFTSVAAGARHHAWLAYATGMLGNYFKASMLPAGPHGRLRETRPKRSPAGREVFSNRVRAYLMP